MPAAACVSLCWTDLSCQRIKLVGKRHAVAAFHHELAFANHVHEFDAGQDCLRRAKRLEAEHRPGDAFDGTMILLHDIVEVFHLPDLDRDFSLRIQLVERWFCRIKQFLSKNGFDFIEKFLLEIA